MRISDWSSDVCSSDLLRRRWRLTSTPHAGFSPSSACSTSKVRNRSMAVMSDKWIRAQALESGMIEPFVDRQTRDGCISYGLSRSEEHTSELQSLMRISYAVFCLKKKKTIKYKLKIHRRIHKNNRHD